MITRPVGGGFGCSTSCRPGTTTALDVVARWFRARHPCELVVVDAATDVRVLADWYAKVLGVPLKGKPPGRPDAAGLTTARVSNPETGHAIAIVAVPRQSDALRPGLHRRDQHVAFEYANVHDLLAAHERLLALRIRPVRSSDVTTAIAYYYEDPEGNSVELTFDPHQHQGGERGNSESRDPGTGPAMNGRAGPVVRSETER